MPIILLSTVFLIIFILFAYIIIGTWTYTDSKTRGLNPILWTAIVLLVPNFIGLLLYFLIGRKQSLTNCVNCNEKIHLYSHFCPNCGIKLQAQSTLPEVKLHNSKALLIGFIGCIIVILISFSIIILNIENF